MGLKRTDYVEQYLDFLDLQFNRELAIQNEHDPKTPAFSNATMLWFLKAWTKIVLGLNGPTYKRTSGYYANPNRQYVPWGGANPHQKAQNDMLTFKALLEKYSEKELSEEDSRHVSQKNGGDFQNADGAMTYMFSLRYTTSAPFQKLLTAYVTQSVDKQMAEEVFQQDRSL